MMRLSGQKGFSLLELLTVMIIVGISSSLVAPNMFASYEKIKSYAEEKKLAALITSVRYRAFFRQVPQVVHCAENVLSLNENEFRFEFNYLNFPETSITFNGHGFADQSVLVYQIRDQMSELRCDGEQ